MISVETIKQFVDYDSITGIFTWKQGRFLGKAAGMHSSNGYISIIINGKAYYAHRLAWFIMCGYMPLEIDHIDHNPSNNAFSNLRESTRAENTANRKEINRNNTTGAKGVRITRQGKFQAYIMHQYKQYSLGVFNTIEEAIAARQHAAKELWGEFNHDAKAKYLSY